MEALLEKEGDVESWNDDRLDELSRRMDAGFSEMREENRGMRKEMKEGFERLERAMGEGFAQTNDRIAQTNDRIDRLMLTLLVGTLGLIGALIGVAVL
jgi:hypothetical protein